MTSSPAFRPKGLRLSVLHGAFRDALSLTRDLNNVTLVGTADTRDNVRSRVVVPLNRNGQVFSASDDAPAVALVVRTLFGHLPHLYLAPVEWNDRLGYVLPTDSDGPRMASGAYAVGDSRWTDLIAAYGYPFGVPVGLHDRHESWALYNAMSRD